MRNLKILVTILFSTVLLLFVGVNHALAQPRHTSCKEYGQETAFFAKGGGFIGTGEVASSGPNVISDVNWYYQTNPEGALCVLP